MNKHKINNSAKIRKAILEDLPQILKRSKTSDRFRMSEYTNEIDEEEIIYWINDSRSIVLVAEIDKKVVGYAYGVIISPRWFFFDAFLVVPEYQNMGIGKKMYQYLRNKCKAQGIHVIQGLVKDSKNNSLNYWLNLGYEEGARCIWVEDWLDED